MDITGLGGLFDFGTKVLERIFPDPKDRLEAQAKLYELQQNGELAQLASETDLAKGQLEINKVEAASNNLFVSGARPFILWICGFAFAYHFILQPLLAFGFSAYGNKIDLPAFNMDALNTVLMGMLGLGSMRSYEKAKGIAEK